MPTHFQGDPKIVQALDVFIKLTRAADTVDARLKKRGTMRELTISQFGVLEILYHLGPMPQCKLASRLLKSSGNITLVIDNLEKMGLVQRMADQNDRRVSQIVLTAAGEKLIAEIFPQHAAAIAEEFSILTGTEQRTLGNLLRKLGLQAA